MIAQEQMNRERPVQLKKSSGASRAGPKTILLHLQSDDSVGSRLQTALSVARASGAHVECLHVTPIEAYVAFDGLGGVFVMNSVIKALDQQEADLKARVENDLRGEDVSWDYVQVTGNVQTQLISRAALSDLVVVGRLPHKSDFVGSALGLLGDLVQGARTPLLIPADDGSSVDPLGSAMIAWDGSYEAANAVRASIDLIRLASAVHVFQISGEQKEEFFPSTRLLHYLSRHGVKAEMSVVAAPADVHDQTVIAATLLARAKALGAAYMVMGGYSRSRIGEYIFGGVTRTLLGACPVPIIIAQ